MRFRHLRAQRAVDPGLDRRGGEAGLLPLVPRLELHEEERRVRRGRAREDAEAVDGDHALHALELAEDALDLPGDLVRALQGGGVGSCTFMSRKPWSSSAMNPVGSFRPMPPARTKKAARIARLSAVLRTRPWERFT
jgi:hypothetical protein